MFKKYIERTLEDHVDLPRVVISNLDPEVIDSVS
jgi:hypothetical protein